MTHCNIAKLNQLGKRKIPFLFIIDFNLTNLYVEPLDQLANDILFSIDGFSNFTPPDRPKIPTHSPIIKQPVSLERYTTAFQTVIEELQNGNTYLLNLTFPTAIEIENMSLLDLFWLSQAKFKLYFQNQFIVFSPERFIHIADQIIKTYPMKGTIDASLPNATETILANAKEMAEHVTIVDLLRNDLSIVAQQVRLEKFRYIDKIKAGERELLQVSSAIAGVFKNSWEERIGDILLALLPAGSISGAPKRKTVEIIHQVEGYDRGFFTGIFGYFDGKKLDSAVMIRFIERQGNQLIYKSGGGITIDSQVETEYQEMLDKVYLPI
jgi:para-aminobenzoate synthetase component 1